jgi:GNAT superfamily N-acetyltransferase
MEIKTISFADIEAAPQFYALLAEYSAESSIAGLGKPCAQLEMYRKLEASGAAHFLGAFIEDELVGFVVLLVSVLPHYGVPVATTESFFVAKPARCSGAGLKLLREAEWVAKQAGAVGVFVSAPVDGVLVEVLPRVGFAETNRVFFKRMQ